MKRVAPPLVALAAVAALTAGCASSTVRTVHGRVSVVAAESFWGDIASQLGGAHADVRSIISNPAQDPHSYEPTVADARALATSQLAIVNGVGYDPWAPRLLAADPARGRVTLTVGTLLGLHDGENPHRWYDPADVVSVAGAISRALGRLYPARARWFERRLRRFDAQGLARYHRVIAQIRACCAGVAVGASESIFALQAPALGLRLITPPGFMKAVSEGVEATAADTAAAERQLRDHAVAVWIYNSQNLTPEVQRLNALARAQRIPTVAVTETLSPAGASFQQWQVAQLTELRAALRAGAGR